MVLYGPRYGPRAVVQLLFESNGIEWMDQDVCGCDEEPYCDMQRCIYLKLQTLGSLCGCGCAELYFARRRTYGGYEEKDRKRQELGSPAVAGKPADYYF